MAGESLAAVGRAGWNRSAVLEARSGAAIRRQGNSPPRRGDTIGAATQGLTITQPGSRRHSSVRATHAALVRPACDRGGSAAGARQACGASPWRRAGRSAGPARPLPPAGAGESGRAQSRGRPRPPCYHLPVSRIHLQQSEAIVLRRHDYGEADRILTLFSRDRGKIRAIAKGVRRIASRKSGHIELFTRCRLLLAKGRNLEVVTQAEMLDAYPALRDDLVRTAYAYHLAELTDRLTAEESPVPGIFQLLADMLAALCQADDPSLVARFFEVRLLGLAGYRPQLFHCALCRVQLAEEGNHFSPSAGGALCPDCGRRAGDALPLDPGAFRVLRYLQTRDWSAAGALRLSPATRGALERLTAAYLQQILERDLSSMGFLRGLRASAGSLGLSAVPADPDPAPAAASEGR